MFSTRIPVTLRLPLAAQAVLLTATFATVAIRFLSERQVVPDGAETGLLLISWATGLALLGYLISHLHDQWLDQGNWLNLATLVSSVVLGATGLGLHIWTRGGMDVSQALLGAGLLSGGRIAALCLSEQPRRSRSDARLPYAAGQAVLAVLLSLATGLAWWTLGYSSDALGAAAAALVISWPYAPEFLASLMSHNSARSARVLGVEISEPDALFQIAQADVIAFDKPSLQLNDQPVVTDVQAFDNKPEPILSLAASAERFARHPIAEAIRQVAGSWGVEQQQPEEWEEVPGLGCVAIVAGQTVAVGNIALMNELRIDCFTANALCKPLIAAGKTCILVAVNNRLTGLLALQGTLDPHTPGTLAGMQDRGLTLALATGTDVHGAGGFMRALGQALPADHLIANIRQDQRLRAVEARFGDTPALFLSSAESGRRGLYTVDASALTGTLLASVQEGRLACLPRLIDVARAANLQVNQVQLVALVLGGVGGLLASAGALSVLAAPLVLALAGVACSYGYPHILRQLEPSYA